MRTRLILSFAIAAAIAAAAGCSGGPGRDGTEQAAFQVPQRDLTLQQPEAPEVRVASPVELARAPVQPGRTPRSRRALAPRPAPAPATSHADASPALPATAASPESIAPAASSAPADTDDPYALPPGKTVTVIPASSGPSTDPGWTDRGPPDAQRGTTIIGGGSGGHGGDCGGRGPRPGRPDGFRGLR